MIEFVRVSENQEHEVEIGIRVLKMEGNKEVD